MKAGLVVAVLTLFAATAQAQIAPVRERIYPAPVEPLTTQGVTDGRLTTVVTSDGLSLQGLSVTGDAARPVILLLHGNGSSAREAAIWFGPLLGLGYGLVAAEYRGYSGNPGTPSAEGLARDADAFFAEAQRMAGSRPIWIVGHSLGGGVAMSLANRHPAQQLVTIGTFTRLKDVVPGMASVVLPDDYRNIDEVPRLTVPWFIIHGLADPVIPPAHGSRLHALAGQSGRQGASFVIRDEGHAPNGATLAAVFEAIRQANGHEPPSPDSLPEAVMVIPFGQSRPLTRAAGQG